MMSGFPGGDSSELVRKLREGEAPIDEALHDEVRPLYDLNGSLGAPLTKVGRDTLGVSADDDIVVATFPNAVLLVPERDIE